MSFTIQELGGGLALARVPWTGGHVHFNLPVVILTQELCLCQADTYRMSNWAHNGGYAAF